MKDKSAIAFALGGLAGNNAHGAGFLQAALTKQVDPIMISCTSGQIYWVHQYLLFRRGAGKANSLGDILARDIEEVSLFHNRDLDLAFLSAFGKQQRFRPAYWEMLADTFRNACHSVEDISKTAGHTFFFREFLQLFPCRTLAPDFGDEFYAEISQEFANAKDIGIAFNSYNPADGREYVYLNQRARALLSRKSNAMRFGKGERSSYRDRVTYHEITPEAVRDGLWIYQYGFDSKENNFVDGAYFRDIMLSELRLANEIYVVRPMQFHWTGHLPTSYPELEDLKTKVAFNGAYAGERYQILLINKLVKNGALRPPSEDKQAEEYHHIDLIEIEVGKPRGYFDYVFESMDVFEDARKRSGDALDRRWQEKCPDGSASSVLG